MSTLTSATSPTKFAVVLLLSSLAFVVALSWNNLIQKVINKYTKQEKSLKGNIYYTIIVTGLLLGVVYLVAEYYPKLLGQVSL